MKTIKKLLGVFFAAVFAFVIASCADDATSTPTSVQTSTPTSTPSTPTSTPSTTSTPAPSTTSTPAPSTTTTTTTTTHTHNFVDGVCGCGATDPNYVPPHTHKFVDGVCECGDHYVAPVSGWTVVSELKDGDNVLIAAPAYNKLLSAEKVATYYNKGVDYTNDNFDNVTNAEIFVVTANTDGSYTFTSLTGDVIALGDDTYSSLNAAGVNKSWTLEEKSTGVFYVKNTVRGNYLEWYASKGNWSTYKTTSLTDLFELSFYKKAESSNVEHVHNYISNVHNATCTEAGYTSFECVCGDSYTEAGAAALGHTYESVVTDPTCEEQGYTTHTCACGDSYVDSYVNAVGHNYEVSYEWSKDFTAVVATGVCTKDATHVITESGNITSSRVEPTEDVDGSITYTATFENAAFTSQSQVEVIPANKHNFTETIINDSTCSEVGQKLITCDCGCGYSQTEEIALKSHTLVDVEGLAATCTEAGYTAYLECSACDYIEGKEEVEALGHGEFTYINKCVNHILVCGHENCEYEEEAEHNISNGVCTDCGYELAVTEVTSVYKLGNGTSTSDSSTAITTSSYSTVVKLTSGDSLISGIANTNNVYPGKEGDLKFSSSNNVGVLNLNLKEATYISKIVLSVKLYGSDSPKVTVAGKTSTTSLTSTYQEITFEINSTLSSVAITSSQKGRFYVNGITFVINGYSNTYEHNYVENVVTAPTCTEEGLKTLTCSCGDSQEVVLKALGHTEVIDAAVAPTCEATGLTEGSHCSECGEVFTAQEEVAALGHDYEVSYEWTEDFTSVVATAVCANDATHVITESGNITPVRVEPTYDADGSITYTATFESDVFTEQSQVEVLPALSHTYVSEVTKQPTCAEEGVTTYSCTCGCGDVYTEAIDKIAHTMEEVSELLPTCTEAGYSAHVACSVCGYTEDKEDLAALGHGEFTYVDNGTDHTKTCGREGCTHEGEAEAHTYVNNECVCGNVQEVSEASSTYRLGNGSTSQTSDGTSAITASSTYYALTDGDALVSAVSFNEKVYSGKGGTLKAGASSAKGSITLTLTESVYVKSIIVNVAAYGTDSTKITVAGKSSSTLSASFEDVTFDINSNLSSIEITTATASKQRFYIASITIIYEA